MDVSPLCHKVTYEPWSIVEGKDILPNGYYIACNVNATRNSEDIGGPWNCRRRVP